MESSSSSSFGGTAEGPEVQAPPGLSKFDQGVNYAGMGSGILSGAVKLLHLSGPLSSIAGPLTVGLSLVTLTRSIWTFVDHPSLGGVVSIASSTFGLALGINMLLGLSAFGPVGWGLAGAVVVG